MKFIILTLVLGIFLNMSTSWGHAWPIGSVVATVLMGIYVKSNQDRHFQELKELLEKRDQRGVFIPDGNAPEAGRSSEKA